MVSHLVMVYDNIPTLVSVALFLLRVCNCLQTLAKAAVSLLEHSDDYHHFSYISLHSIKAMTCQLCYIFFVKAITFEFWLHQLYRQSLKSYLAVLPILIVDHSNTARESGFAIKYGTMPQGMIVMHS